MGLSPEIVSGPGRIRVVLSRRIYSRTAAELAARVLSGRTAIELGAAGDGDTEAFLRSREDAGEFLNEALNQQCRMDLAARNSAAADLITVKALLSASPGTGKIMRKSAARRRAGRAGEKI